MIPPRPDQIPLPAPTELAMLLVRSPRQQAQGLELIHTLGGARERRRWEAAVRQLKSSQWVLNYENILCTVDVE